MLDMRLYKPSDNFEDAQKYIEEMDRVIPDDPTARSIEVIAGKVVKYLLTEKGSDAFDFNYGGTSMHYRQIAPEFLPQFRREVAIDVENCERYIKDKEVSNGVEGERLHSIKLLKVVYEPRLTPTRVDVYLEIFTTYGKHACVAITSRTNS